MGGETWNDYFVVVTGVFGTNLVDDGLIPGYMVPDDVAGPDSDANSLEPVPNTVMFVANPNKPTSTNDYPLRKCEASGYWGAPHAMVQVDGRFYLREFAPDPRLAKKYPERGYNQ